MRANTTVERYEVATLAAAPADITANDLQPLRELGFSDAEILAGRHRVVTMPSSSQ